MMRTRCPPSHTMLLVTHQYEKRTLQSLRLLEACLNHSQYTVDVSRTHWYCQQPAADKEPNWER